MKKTLIVLIAGSLLSMNVNADETLTASPSKRSPESMQVSLKESNKAKGEAFLAENKKKSGVVTLPDGLQYKIITAGTGAHPSDQDVVTVHYVGTFIEGKEFDSSYKRKEPAKFPVNGVISGWTEALKLMNKGATWELFIPAELAYGESGAPPVIGPNETLHFKVTLLEIEKQP